MLSGSACAQRRSALASPGIACLLLMRQNSVTASKFGAKIDTLNSECCTPFFCCRLRKYCANFRPRRINTCARCRPMSPANPGPALALTMSFGQGHPVYLLRFTNNNNTRAWSRYFNHSLQFERVMHSPSSYFTKIYDNKLFANETIFEPWQSPRTVNQLFQV